MKWINIWRSEIWIMIMWHWYVLLIQMNRWGLTALLFKHPIIHNIIIPKYSISESNGPRLKLETIGSGIKSARWGHSVIFKILQAKIIKAPSGKLQQPLEALQVRLKPSLKSSIISKKWDPVISLITKWTLPTITVNNLKNHKGKT